VHAQSRDHGVLRLQSDANVVGLDFPNVHIGLVVCCGWAIRHGFAERKANPIAVGRCPDLACREPVDKVLIRGAEARFLQPRCKHPQISTLAAVDHHGLH
jgi:hypothetical protein